MYFRVGRMSFCNPAKIDARADVIHNVPSGWPHEISRALIGTGPPPAAPDPARAGLIFDTPDQVTAARLSDLELLSNVTLKGLNNRRSETVGQVKPISRLRFGKRNWKTARSLARGCMGMRFETVGLAQ